MLAFGVTHIVLAPSAAGVLRQALQIAGRRDMVVGFNDGLARGPIDPPAPWTRSRWMTDVLGYIPEEYDWQPRSTRNFWRRAFAPAKRRIVWTSSRSANEQTAFLALVDHMGERPFEVVDTADIDVAHSAPGGRHWRGKALSLAMLDPPSIAAERLWVLARPLSPVEHAAHLAVWSRLRAENAPLRLIGPNGLRSAPITAFDTALLSHASENWGRLSHLIGHVLAQDDGLYFQAGDVVLGSRVAHLIASNALEYRPPPEGSSHGYRLVGGVLPLRGEVRLAQR